MSHILVIKLGALGDFIQATGAMAAIRKHHKDDKITLLTTKAFQKIAQDCGYFDDIMIDDRPKWYQIGGWLDLRSRLIQGNFARVYDLQNNDRTGLYFKLFPSSNNVEWVGIAKGASHRNTSPERTAGHAFEGHAQTLSLAGIKDIEVDKLDWMKAETKDLGLKDPFILLVPGCSPDHPEKRWPPENFAAIAHLLIEKGYQPVVLGTKDEKDVTDQIEKECPQVLNLNGKTSLYHIAALACQAKMAIGNDTGPMHMAGATGCPCLVFFCGNSNPKRHAPIGATVRVLQEDNINDVSLEIAKKNLEEMLLGL